ncbi:Holliday junction resolvase RecU, partial [Streptococcus oralis]|nr:Holliday junction resolvase RecU [Streptococcus oralis]
QDKGQKSMPLGYIRENGYRIEPGAFPQIPYLDVIKEHLLGGKTR